MSVSRSQVFSRLLILVTDEYTCSMSATVIHCTGNIFANTEQPVLSSSGLDGGKSSAIHGVVTKQNPVASLDGIALLCSESAHGLVR